jgi:cytochrome c peroxidase
LTQQNEEDLSVSAHSHPQSLAIFIVTASVAVAASLLFAGAASAQSNTEPNVGPLRTLPNATGAARTFTPNGSINTGSTFFQNTLGTNGQSCGTCHLASDDWTISAASVQHIFDQTEGTDPLFRPNDTANAPTMDVSTVDARRIAYSLILNRGVVRIGLAMPANAEFTLEQVQDPFGYASAKELSLYRRPLPTTNMRFLTAVNWDGRASLRDLQGQARGVVTRLLQASTPPTQAQLDDIVAFETSIFTAQVMDNAAGDLESRGAQGGPFNLFKQPFFIGINDLADKPDRAAFDPHALTLYQAWATEPDASAAQDDAGFADARRSVARGEEIFDTFPIRITGVAGLNDDQTPLVVGTCTTCHNAPNVGDHSVPLPLNIGVSDVQRNPDLPVYTLRNSTTGAIARTTDPGRALITGKWNDIARFKGPILRGVAARAPYFHNGLAKDLTAVVAFYDDRFKLGLSATQKEDLVAFLRTL